MIPKLNAMTRAYLECALWSSTGDDEEPLDANYDVSDLDESALKQAIDDCADFELGASAFIYASGLTPEQVGHDFWLTRNRHGAGFWDRDLGLIGDELTKLAHPYGEVDVYVGDDSRIYFA